MSKQQESNGTKQLEYIKGEDFTTVKGVFKGFKHSDNTGTAIIVDTGNKLVGVGLNTVLIGAIKTAIRKGLLVADKAEVELIKGEKAEGKKYFLSSIKINGELIEEQTFFSAEELLNLI